MADFHLFKELQRRNVLRAAVLYVGVVWLLAQIVTQLGPVFDVPLRVARWFLAASAVGFPLWIALAWFYELTPDGLKRESEVAPGESIRRLTSGRLDRAIIAVLAVAVVLLVTHTFMWHKGTSPDDTVSGIPEKSVAVLPLVNGGQNGVRFTYSRLNLGGADDARAGCRRSVGSWLRHRTEVIATQGALLLKVGSDGFQVVVGQGFV